MAGHRFPSTTERYKPTNLKELLGAVERFHPMGWTDNKSQTR
jgi:hypothetical protein